MQTKFRIGFIVIGFGWFPMMFISAAASGWSKDAAFTLLIITFVTCVVGMIFILSMPIDDIFKSSKILKEEIRETIETRLDYNRWIEAVKREAVSKAGLKFSNIQDCYDRLVKDKWKK
jgi:hypothetical protein